jgi:hypothetical protein
MFATRKIGSSHLTEPTGANRMASPLDVPWLPLERRGKCLEKCLPCVPNLEQDIAYLRGTARSFRHG